MRTRYTLINMLVNIGGQFFTMLLSFISRMVFIPGGDPKAKGVSASKDWEIVSIDSKDVPLAVSGVEIRPVDVAAVMRLIRASKGTIQIPGIVYRAVAKMSFSRRG